MRRPASQKKRQGRFPLNYGNGRSLALSDRAVHGGILAFRGKAACQKKAFLSRSNLLMAEPLATACLTCICITVSDLNALPQARHLMHYLMLAACAFGWILGFSAGYMAILTVRDVTAMLFRFFE